MRQSQIAMLSAGGVVVGAILVLAVVVRVGLGEVEAGERERDLGERVTRTRPLEGFTSVAISGAWRVELERGEQFRVELEYPEGVEERLEVEVRGMTLVLDSENAGGGRWGFFGGEELDLHARVVMPELDTLEIAGTSELGLEGFEGTRLVIEVAGAANVESGPGRYEALALEVSGAGRVDLSDMAFHDVNVELSGAADVLVTMTGGVLSGSLSGVGNVRYRGTVSAERVEVSGFGRVEAEN